MNNPKGADIDLSLIIKAMHERHATEIAALTARVGVLERERASIKAGDEISPGLIAVEKVDANFACHVEVGVGEPPDDDCVLDYHAPEDCIYARNLTTKWQCQYWCRREALTKPEAV